MLQAVLTGDIVNSTKLDTEREQILLKELEKILSPYRFEFYRGDSFQAYLENPAEALQTALLCRTVAIGLMPEEEVVSDVRISIGIGTVVEPLVQLASAKGEAFLLSGRALDELEKTAGRLIITTENKLAGLGLGVMADYINSIYKQMTAKQAEVIAELLTGVNQQQVAERLNRSKSTISQHVTAGRWDEIENILKKYRTIAEILST